MAKTDWKDELASFMDDLRVVDECKIEAPEKFNQFCEFIAESSFEGLSEELKIYGIKSKVRKEKGKSIAFEVNFPKSRVDNFHYVIRLPNNALDLQLRLLIKGRKDKKSQIEEKEVPFMKHIKPSNVLKMSKEELILDVIKNYKKFIYEVLIHPE
jgi:formyltetrahydrofolate hydrolase